MFSLDEKVVYPGHGVAQISRIVERNVGGCSTRYYELTMVSTRMTVLVPVESLSQTGIRNLSSTQSIEDMFRTLETSSPKRYEGTGGMANWSKKNKAYQCAIRTGALDAVCKIYSELICTADQKELSFGEKTLLHKTENLLVEEIAVATQASAEKVRTRLRSAVRHVSM